MNERGAGGGDSARNLPVTGQASDFLLFGDIVVGVSLGAIFPCAHDALGLVDSVSVAIGLAHIALLLFVMLSLVWYWVSTRTWALTMRAHYAGSHYMAITIVALGFYLMACLAVERDLTRFLLVVFLLFAFTFLIDLAMTFGPVRSAARRGHDAGARAAYSIQSSLHYILRGLVVNLLLALLALIAVRGLVRSEVVFAWGVVLTLTVVIAAAELLTQRWRRVALAKTRG